MSLCAHGLPSCPECEAFAAQLRATLRQRAATPKGRAPEPVDEGFFARVRDDSLAALRTPAARAALTALSAKP